LSLGFLGAAPRPAAFSQSVGELTELDRRLVRLRQAAGDLAGLLRRVAEKIKEQPLAVEQVLDID
jgi:hypothetical protein